MLKREKLIKVIKNRKLHIVLPIVIFAGLMTWLIFISSAATPFTSIESEAGNVVGADVISDSSAAGGAYLQFGTINPTPTSGEDTVYVSAAELSAIKAKVNNGAQPWTKAYSKLISDANTALNSSAVSVVDNGGGSSGAHYFATDTPYTTDGVYDPNANREDYSKAFRLGIDLPALGLAYRLSGDTKYASKALQLIKAWAINPTTYMEPVAYNYGPATSGHKSGGVIEIFITMPGIIYGADLIWGYNGWTSSDRTTFTNWVHDLGVDTRDRKDYDHNFDDWRVDLIAAAGAFTNNDSLLDYAWQRFKFDIDDQMDGEGKMVQELGRTRSLHYSLYALNAMFQTAEIARQHGVDLYNYTVNGKNLQKAADFHAPFILNPSSWPYEEIGTLSEGEEIPMYELAHSKWQKSTYLNVINKFGRPIIAIRNMDNITLTHGNRFELGL